MDRAQTWLRASRRLVLLTGAGVSAESGVPTFRDAHGGLWARFDPATLASAEGFRGDPALVWRWYAWRRELVLSAQPNAAHRAIAQAGERHPALSVITQNVDGLHQRAGSENVIELHGNILRTKCLAECGVLIDDPQSLPQDGPPRCPRCGDRLRPDVVWFGEMLDPGTLARAGAAAGRCDLMLVVGTSGLVYPAAGLPSVARRSGARIVIVNPEQTELDRIADATVRLPAAVAIPELLSVL
jgi:NAD-dependent deacetylase